MVNTALFRAKTTIKEHLRGENEITKQEIRHRLDVGRRIVACSLWRQRR
jgi:hypothetical protein